MAIPGGSGSTPLTVLVPVVASEQPATPVTEHSGHSGGITLPAAQAVHDTVSGVANALGAGPRRALREISGKEPPEEGAAGKAAAAETLSGSATSQRPGRRTVRLNRPMNSGTRGDDEPEATGGRHEGPPNRPRNLRRPATTKDPESTSGL